VSCRHGWYGHGPGGCDDWYGPPGAYGPPVWYGPPAWYDEDDEPRPSWRGARRARRRGGDAAAGDLEATLEELRAEMQRVEDELAKLRASEA
jgi:hypothetical protein